MTVNAYNLAILLGTLHGLVLSFLLFATSKNHRAANILLALVLLFYTLPVLRVALNDIGFFSLYDLPFLSIELIYGLGPSLYLYAKTISDPEYKLSRTDFLHFLPVLFEVIYYFSSSYSQVGHPTFSPPRNIHHLLWMIQQAGSVVSVFVYLGLTNKLLWNYSRWLKNNYSATRHRTLKWLQTPIILYSTFFILWFSLRIFDVIYFADSLSIFPYYPFLLFLSFSTYWIGTKGYLQNQIDTTGYSKSLSKNDHRVADTDDQMLIAIYKDLIKVMPREKLYLDNDLNLTQLSRHFAVNPRLLSKAINTQAKMNFYDFINQYRVEEFKHKIVRPETRGKLIDIAFECGFSSKATFNHIFKSSTGHTPSQYRKQFGLLAK